MIQFDPKFGWASIIALAGFPATLVMIGVAWGSLNGKVDASATLAALAKTEAAEVNKNSIHRDEKISQQAERLGKIETSVQFIVPALQRIEAKLDATKP